MFVPLYCHLLKVILLLTIYSLIYATKSIVCSFTGIPCPVSLVIYTNCLKSTGKFNVNLFYEHSTRSLIIIIIKIPGCFVYDKSSPVGVVDMNLTTIKYYNNIIIHIIHELDYYYI